MLSHSQVEENSWVAIFVDCGIFAYFWGCNFMDALVFSFSKKVNSKFIFIEDVNSWRRARYEYQEN